MARTALAVLVASGLVGCRPVPQPAPPRGGATPLATTEASTEAGDDAANAAKPEAETAVDLGPIDRQRAEEFFAEFDALCSADGGALWGTSVCGLMLFVDPQSRAVVGNRALAGHLRPHGKLFAGRLPDEMVVANTATQWEGQSWTMLIWWSLAAESKPRNRLLAHEAFHRVQRWALGRGTTWPTVNPGRADGAGLHDEVSPAARAIAASERLTRAERLADERSWAVKARAVREGAASCPCFGRDVRALAVGFVRWRLAGRQPFSTPLCATISRPLIEAIDAASDFWDEGTRQSTRQARGATMPTDEPIARW